MSYINQSEVPKDKCAICFETLKDPSKADYRLTCGHIFHNNCLNLLCENSYPIIKCPICRTKQDKNECNQFYAFKERVLDENYVNSLPKDIQNIYNNNIMNQGGRHKKNRTKKHRQNKTKKFTKRRCFGTKRRKYK